MNTNQLFSKFSHALNWNAFSYTIYKILFTALSWTLYFILTSYEFSVWANINCMVYLLLLWADCGFRKSIPRFAPVFAHNKTTFSLFTHGIIIFQSTLILLLIPLYIFSTKHLITIPIQYYFLGVFLFITEGMIAILRLIFHSYFWQKQFNIIATSFMILQMTINLFFIFWGYQGLNLVSIIIITKIFIGILIVTTSLIVLKRINKEEIIHGNSSINIKKSARAFAKHSAIMWFNNNIKSLSERNFLVPFLTATVGPTIANTFKVANDGALFFYRIVIKTIGTSDTSLFSFLEVKKAKHTLFNIAFKKLTLRIALLCIPLLSIVGALYLDGTHVNNNTLLKALTIMAVGYLIETLFLPYERILEVKRRYWYLFFCYIPYICMLFFLISGTIFGSLSLIKAVIIIHAIRLISLFLMVTCAWFLYGIKFPIKYIFIISATSILIVIFLYGTISSYLVNIMYYFAPKLCN